MKRNMVKVGTAQVTIFAHSQGWRFAWLDGGRWRYTTRKSLAAAKKAAESTLKAQAAGVPVWESLPAEERGFLLAVHKRANDPLTRRAVLAWLDARKTSADAAEAVQTFLDDRKARKGGGPRHEYVRTVLEGLTAAFPDTALSDIGAPALRKWLAVRTKNCDAGAYNVLLGVVRMFWRWARTHELVADGVIEPDKIPTKKVSAANRRVLTPDELKALLEAVEPEWRAWVVLQAWCGLRPSEAYPGRSSRLGKVGIRGEDIDWQFKVLRIRAETSKVNRPRIVPLCDAALAGLEWAGVNRLWKGAICRHDPVRMEETLRLGKLLFGGKWPQDALRHSYGSYRNAELRSLEQVAEEMGTSVAMLHRHYHNPQPSDTAATWFDGGLLPKNVRWKASKKA